MNFTDHGENKMADWVRGQGLTLPSSWFVAPATAADDGSLTELSGSGLSRANIARSLTNWSGTQGAGTTLVSSGTSHLSSNNIAIDMGTATGAVGTVSHVVFKDAASAGNGWIWAELETPIVTANGVPVVIDIGELAFTLGLAGGMSNYLSNKVLDRLLRAQAYDWPASVYVAALTAAPNNAGGGTEVGGGVGYERLEIVSSMANLSGTQSAGSTSASTGTGGRISNNLLLTMATPTGSWGTVGWAELLDAATLGNLLFWAPLAAQKTIGIGRPMTFAANALGLTWA